jgi:hypothetical protein
MRARLVLAPALAAGLLLATAGAEAATPTLDGKKTKKLTFVDDGGAQSNDAWTVYDLAQEGDLGDSLPDQLRRVDPADCQAPLCGVHEFVYKPAKGVKGGIMVTTTWANPVSDADISFMQIEKDGSRTEIGSCGFTGQPHEKIYVEPSALKAGKKYAVVVMFFRSAAETFTTEAEINVPSTIKSTTGFPEFDCAL